MTQVNVRNTYQYMFELEEEKLAEAKSLEEKNAILMHFRYVRDTLYQRDLELFNTAA